MTEKAPDAIKTGLCSNHSATIKEIKLTFCDVADAGVSHIRFYGSKVQRWIPEFGDNDQYKYFFMLCNGG